MSRRKTVSIPSAAELPDYLGFGVLDRNSVVQSDAGVSANYVQGEEVVYEIMSEKSQCQISEYFQGEWIGESRDRVLEQAFLRHFSACSPFEHPRFGELYNQLTAGRNISVIFPQRPQAVYFPAGLIFSVRLPLVKGRNRKAWSAFRESIKLSPESKLLQFGKENKGVLFRLSAAGEVSHEDILVGACTAMLINVARVVDLIWESGVVLPEKEYRLTVMDGPQARLGSLPIFLGDPARGFTTYSFVPLPHKSFNADVIESAFLDQSHKFLDSLANRQVDASAGRPGRP